MEVEKEGCRLCGASEVRDGRSVCDVCLGFVERIKEPQLGMSSENKMEKPRRGFTCGRCGTMWTAEHFDSDGNVRTHPKNNWRMCCWSVAMKNARQAKVKENVEVQTIRQEAPEPKLDLRICDDCKEEFTPYRRADARR